MFNIFNDFFFVSIIIFEKSIGEIIREFQDNVVNNTRKGLASVDNRNDAWGFSGAFLFSLTVITTIGKRFCSDKGYGSSLSSRQLF